jgi:hypothetical protein
MAAMTAREPRKKAPASATPAELDAAQNAEEQRPAELPRVEDPDAPIDWEAVRAAQRRALDEQEIDNARRIAGTPRDDEAETGNEG